MRMRRKAKQLCAFGAQLQNLCDGRVVVVLVAVVAGLKPGQRVPVKLVERDGKTRTAMVTLGDLQGS